MTVQEFQMLLPNQNLPILIAPIFQVTIWVFWITFDKSEIHFFAVKITRFRSDKFDNYENTYLPIYQQIRWLQIPMKNTMMVAISYAHQ